MRWVGWGRGEVSGQLAGAPSGLAGHVDCRRCFMPSGWVRPPRAAEGAGALLSWCPDLARCLGPSSFSLLTIPLLVQGPSIFGDTCFFFHEISHQLPHPILCSPKVPTLVTEMD